MAIKDQIEQIANKLTNQPASDASLSAHLGHLISLNKDAAEGFRNAASMMEEAQDELLFTTYADQRERFANVLQSYADDPEGDAPAFVKAAEDFAAAAHRVWMRLRANVSDSKLNAMLRESMRGDEKILAAYDLAVRASTSRTEVHDRLTSQRADIRAVQGTLERLLNESSAPSA